MSSEFLMKVVVVLLCGTGLLMLIPVQQEHPVPQLTCPCGRTPRLTVNTRFRARIVCECGRVTAWHADIRATYEEWWNNVRML